MAGELVQFWITQTDDGPAIEGTLTDAEGHAVHIADDDEIKCLVWKSGAATRILTLDGEKVDGHAGKISVDVSGETDDLSYLLRCRFKITDNTGSKRNYPNNGSFRIYASP